jgi:hypothetical protein
MSQIRSLKITHNEQIELQAGSEFTTSHDDFITRDWIDRRPLIAHVTNELLTNH